MFMGEELVALLDKAKARQDQQYQVGAAGVYPAAKHSINCAVDYLCSTAQTAPTQVNRAMDL